MSESSKTDNNAFLASESSLMRNAMQNRCLASDVPHLKPILDSLPPSSVVCEVGCGPGGITLDIAQRYPHLVVLGMDIDEQSIKQANEAAISAGTSNLRYAVADAVNLSALAATPGFEALNGSCDLVYTNAAAMHTGDSLKTIKQMRLASKTGGHISLHEGDMSLFFVWPENEGMKKFLQVLPRLGTAKGADPNLGRKLMSYAMAVGYSRDDIIKLGMDGGGVSRPQERQGLAYCFGEILNSTLADPARKKASDIDEADVTLIMKGFEEWSKWEDGLIFWPSVVITCVKT